MFEELLASVKEANEMLKSRDEFFSGKISLDISPKLHKKAAVAAKKAGISLDEFVSEAITDALNLSVDAQIACERLEQNSPRISLEKLEKELDLEDRDIGQELLNAIKEINSGGGKRISVAHDFDGFNINVFKTDDGKIRAHFSKFPNISATAETVKLALEDLENLWKALKIRLEADGTPAPRDQDWIMLDLALPEQIREGLIRLAKEENRDLNELIISTLAESLK